MLCDLQNSAVSGIVYDHIYPYLHNTLKAAVKPVSKFPRFVILYCVLSLLLLILIFV